MSWIQRYKLRTFLRNSVWILPVLGVAAALVSVHCLHWVEQRAGWQVGFNPASALAVFGALAASLLTFIVFLSSSLLLVVQLASAQLSPRAIGIVFRNPVTRFSLTLFTFTFTFTLAFILRIDDSVPTLTAHVAAYLCLLCVGVFLFLIDHVGRLLRPSGVLLTVARLGHAVIGSVYPRRLADLQEKRGPVKETAGEPSETVLSPEDGVLLAFDPEGLVALAREADCVVELIPEVGDFVAAGSPLFRVFGGKYRPSTKALCESVALIDTPEPLVAGPTEVKLRILEAGICGTDREITSFQYGTPPADSPHLVIGHEALGEVIEVGRGVTGLAPGDLAVPMVRRPCPHERCAPCRRGRQDFCITGDLGIKGAHGYMAEFVADDERYMVKVPKELREVAILLEPLTVAEKAAEQVRALAARLPGELKNDPGNLSAVVLGAGPIGLLGAMKLVNGGFNTWVYSRDSADSQNVLIAEAIGARFVSSAELSPAELARMVGNISLVYEATGAAKVSFEVLSVLGVNGVYIFTGVPGVRGPVEIDADRIMRNLVLSNQVLCGTVNAGRVAFEEGVQDLAAFLNRFPAAVRAMITARVSLDDARAAVLSRGGIKSVIAFA